MTSGLRRQLISIAAFVGLWQLAAIMVDSHKLPSPRTVLLALGQGITDGALPYHIGVTLGRVAISFIMSMLIGIGIGIVLGRRPRLDQFFNGWLGMLLNMPVLVLIVLCYVWLGLTETAAILAVTLNKIPLVAVTVREGARALNPEYLEMAEVFRFGRAKTLRHVILPELAPYIFAAARSGLALIWKIVLVVEAFGRSNGVGFQINTDFHNFDVPDILACTVAFITIIQVIEFAIMRPIERRATQWRR
jgi:NitT/TauT family transport system permease protein